MRLSRFLIFSAFMAVSFLLRSQPIGIGEWRDHMPYNNCTVVTRDGNKIYAATPLSLFSLDQDDNAITRMSKVNGLSDIGISTIEFSQTYRTLLVAYSNANIDLVHDHGVVNIADIKRKPILGYKTINKIFYDDKYAYLSCGFGIVVFNMAKQEIHDTYFIGPNGTQINVLGLTMFNDTIFAATEKGIYMAPKNAPNLANYAYWQLVPGMNPLQSYSHIATFNDKIIVNKNGINENTDTIYYYNGTGWHTLLSGTSNEIHSIRSTPDQLIITYNYYVDFLDQNMTSVFRIWNYYPESPYSNDAIMEGSNLVWIGDTYKGLVKFDKAANVFEKIIPNGPYSSNVFDMSQEGGELWVAAGGVSTSWGNIWSKDGLSVFDGTSWGIYNRTTIPSMDTLIDIVAVAVNPLNHKQVFAGSWGKGAIEFNDHQLVNRFTDQNSSLQRANLPFFWIGVGGVSVDKEGRAWFTNNGANDALSVRKADGAWKALSPEIGERGVAGLYTDSYGYKWIFFPKEIGIAVFTDNGTIENQSDDRTKILNNVTGNGGLPGNVVRSIAEDLEGRIWVGTDNGVAVFYNPENIFSGQPFDAQKPLVEYGGYVQYLLENETVNAIAIDGANNKWFGTDRSGAYLVSSDGTKEIHHFTVDNSPILSNSIRTISIDNQTGEVYFGTDKGIISYKGTATQGGDKNENVYAYPNPVREGYTGYIAIKGLVTSADVKITDVAGNVIFATRAEGGQAVWNGRNYEGRKAATGVYLVYATNDDGKETVVTKILFIN